VVSLCVVARNEARFIKACIDSARPAVSEVIVVDTGSTDGTPDLARDAGARVYCRKWPGDLGTAHNLPLEYASRAWILSLDADEILDPEACGRLPGLLRAAASDGYYTPIRNYVYGHAEGAEWVAATDPRAWGASAYVPTSVVRLFRRRDRYRFSGCVHQSIAAAIRRAGGRLGASDLTIHHYGLLRSDRDKSTFYRALARRQLSLRPRDARAWIELATTFAHLPFALDAFRQAERYGHRAAAAYFVGATLCSLSRPRLAIPYLRRAVRLSGRRRSPYFARADALEQLAAAYDMLDRPASAIRLYEQALRARPKSASVLNNLAAILAERGDWTRANELFAVLRTLHPGLDATWVTLGTASLRRGEMEDAVRALTTALEINPCNPTARFNLNLTRGTAPSIAVTRATHESRTRRDTAGNDIERALPSVDRRRRQQALRPLAAGGVISVIAYLHGGAGRVLVDVIRALPERPHLVVCGEGGTLTWQALHEELDGLGVEVRTAASREALDETVARCRPAWVIHHWWPAGPLSPVGRVADERWIVVGHVAQPMPLGYDIYVTLSDFHESLQPHVPPERLRRISNGVDPRRFPRRTRHSGQPVTIAMLSRLEPSKFPRRLLANLPSLRELDARILIAGAGGRRLEIEPEVEAAGLSDIVRFVGPLRASEVPAFLGTADIGLHLTEACEEVCSMTILEMLAAGLPIVAERKGSLAEQVQHGVNGYLAESEDQVRQRLAELVGDASLRQRMGNASRHVAKRYRIERFERAWRTLLQTRIVDGDDAGGRRLTCAMAPTPLLFRLQVGGYLQRYFLRSARADRRRGLAASRPRALNKAASRAARVRVESLGLGARGRRLRT
jgi:glycosyltransferase involved in cell wall biosynthesis